MAHITTRTTCSGIALILAGAMTMTALSPVAGSSRPILDDPPSSPVTFHLSFDTPGFMSEDFISRSGRVTLEERGIEFPPGRFGSSYRMNRIPDPPDISNMTGIDLDLVTAAMFNTRADNRMGYDQLMMWGTGKVHPRLGAVAFWAKGELPFYGLLFEQTSVAFGRTERDLLGIFVDEEFRLSAYLRDASYHRHEIRSDAVWNPEEWNHIVLNWDWAEGFELWLNGEVIASSMGEGGWYETAPPGLFHLPMPRIQYDELYLMDRPLSGQEIARLISLNQPPVDDETLYQRSSYHADRVAKWSGAHQADRLPAVTPGLPVTFTEVWPEYAGDGNLPGWLAIDGRNEMAWPHPYGYFTVIPGDADFHAEKLDIQPPANAPVNYISLTGNLTNVRVEGGSPERNLSDREILFHVPAGSGFFYGSLIPSTTGSVFRIPFTEAYGTPGDYSFEGARYRIPYNEKFSSPRNYGGNVRLPLSGKKRLQNVGLYHVRLGGETDWEEARPLYRIPERQLSSDSRFHFLIRSVTTRDERTFASTTGGGGSATAETVDIGAFQRLQLVSEPIVSETGVVSVSLSLPLKTQKSEEALLVRVHDPALPGRLWNEFALRLEGFDREFGVLNLTIDFHDLVVTGGDRLWISLGTAGPTELLLGDRQRPALMRIGETESWRVADAWADKQLVPAQGQYAKMYGYMPWKFTRREVTVERPYALGGPFDMLLPALAVERVKPDHFLANFFIRAGTTGYPGNVQDTPLITLTDPYGAPDWALYMRDLNRKRHAIVEWWADRQNPDGQIGGGWNDDPLFMISGLKDILFDGNEKARRFHDRLHYGLERTHLYKDGFANIYPVDAMHDADMISERYNTVMHNLGQPHAVEREMEPAWRVDKPEQTPINYNDALALRSSRNVLQWYWGEVPSAEPYRSEPLEKIADDLRLQTSVLDDHYFHHLTAAGIHTTAQGPYGSRNLFSWLLGGSYGPRWDARPDLAVAWPAGGGPEVARVVLSADDRSLEVSAYSFHGRTQEVEMQLMRIEDGRYRISLHRDPEGIGEPGERIWSVEKDLVRFDRLLLPLPPQTPVVIRMEQLARTARPARLPDLAINPWGAARRGSLITATIHNLGNAPAENIVVRLMDGENVLQERIIDRLEAPTDFIPRRTQVHFNNVPPASGRNLRVMIDPEHTIREILRSNNEAPVGFSPESSL